MNLTEWGKSVKVAPSEVKFASTWLWSSFSNLWRACKIIVEIHTQQNSPHGLTLFILFTSTMYAFYHQILGEHISCVNDSHSQLLTGIISSPYYLSFESRPLGGARGPRKSIEGTFLI